MGRRGARNPRSIGPDFLPRGICRLWMWRYPPPITGVGTGRGPYPRAVKSGRESLNGAMQVTYAGASGNHYTRPKTCSRIPYVVRPSQVVMLVPIWFRAGERSDGTLPHGIADDGYYFVYGVRGGRGAFW